MLHRREPNFALNERLDRASSHLSKIGKIGTSDLRSWEFEQKIPLFHLQCLFSPNQVVMEEFLNA